MRSDLLHRGVLPHGGRHAAARPGGQPHTDAVSAGLRPVFPLLSPLPPGVARYHLLHPKGVALGVRADPTPVRAGRVHREGRARNAEHRERGRPAGAGAHRPYPGAGHHPRPAGILPLPGSAHQSVAAGCGQRAGAVHLQGLRGYRDLPRCDQQCRGALGRGAGSRQRLQRDRRDGRPWCGPAVPEL